MDRRRIAMALSRSGLPPFAAWTTNGGAGSRRISSSKCLQKPLERDDRRRRPRRGGRAELDLAMQSPYVKGSARLRNRLRKRDWLLATYRKCNRLLPCTSQIERRHRLTRGEFLADYYSTGRAVVITGMMDDWPAAQVESRLFRGRVR